MATGTARSAGNEMAKAQRAEIPQPSPTGWGAGRCIPRPNGVRCRLIPHHSIPNPPFIKRRDIDIRVQRGERWAAGEPALPSEEMKVCQ
jgi:hypothetical protein